MYWCITPIAGVLCILCPLLLLLTTSISSHSRAYALRMRRACSGPGYAPGSSVVVCVCVCVCVCVLSHISPLERLFVQKTLSRTQRATKVKRFSPGQMRCRDRALLPIYRVGHFSYGESCVLFMRIVHT